MEDEGIELHGTAQLVLSGGGTCNVLESDTSYEERKGNHGAPMDIWRLDFSVHNESGRWLDHLIATFQIESVSPDCTNWDGPEAGTFPHFIVAGFSNGHIQESGRGVVAPRQVLSHTQHFIVLRGDPQPRFLQWWLDFRFAAAVPPASAPTASAEQETVFWQSILNSTNSADFKAYLRQFPQGVFRALAQNRLADLGASGSDSPAANRSPAEVDSQASRPIPQSAPAPQRICEEDRPDEDPPCWMELASRSGCYLWRPERDLVMSTEYSVTWTGGCAEGKAYGSGVLKFVLTNFMDEDEAVELEGSGEVRGGRQAGPWVLRASYGSVYEGAFEDGKQHGFWVFRDEDGGRWEGHLDSGRFHGRWNVYGPSGKLERSLLWEHGEFHGSNETPLR